MPKEKDFYELMAEGMGLVDSGRNGNVDALRHIHASAQATKTYGSTIARIGGSAREWGTHIEGKVGHFLGIKDKKSGRVMQDGNPTDEWQMDEYNNAIGRELGQRAVAENWDDDRLIEEVGKVIREGRAKTLVRGEDPDAATGYPGYGASVPAVDKIIYHADRMEELRRKRAEGSVKTVQGNNYRTPPIVAQVGGQGMSPQASILDSLLAYFGKK